MSTLSQTNGGLDSNTLVGTIYKLKIDADFQNCSRIFPKLLVTLFQVLIFHCKINIKQALHSFLHNNFNSNIKIVMRLLACD